jgi:hypothetical protein
MAILGQRTEAMARRYSNRQRDAEAGIAMFDKARAARNGNTKLKTATDAIENRSADDAAND